MMLKIGRFGKWFRNDWEVLKCGGSKGWTRSVRPIISETEYYKESRRRGI